MKILLSVFLACASIAAQTALAGQWRYSAPGPMLQAQMQHQRPGGMQQPPQRDNFRPQRPPERAPERPDGRMTDQERRDLRRDIDRANREIYKGR
jgi:hypothetical protein